MAMCEIDTQRSQPHLHIKNTGISKFENTQRPVVRARNLPINFEPKILHAVPLIWPPPRAASTGRKPAPHLRAPKVEPPRLASSTQLYNFLQISTNLCALPVRDVTRTPSPVSSRTIVTSE